MSHVNGVITKFVERVVSSQATIQSQFQNNVSNCHILIDNLANSNYDYETLILRWWTALVQYMTQTCTYKIVFG